MLCPVPTSTWHHVAPAHPRADGKSPGAAQGHAHMPHPRVKPWDRPPTPTGCPWPQPLVLGGTRLPKKQQDSASTNAGWGSDAAGQGRTVFPPPTLLGAHQHLGTTSQSLVTTGSGPAHSLGAWGAQAHGQPWEWRLPSLWEIQPHCGKPTRFSAGGQQHRGDRDVCTTQGQDLWAPVAAKEVSVRGRGCSPQPGSKPPAPGVGKRSQVTRTNPGVRVLPWPWGTPPAARGMALLPPKFPQPL